MLLWKARTVNTIPAARPEANRFRQDKLLLVPPALNIWAETNLQTGDYMPLVKEMHNGAVLLGTIGCSTVPLCVAIAVSETPPGSAMNPHAALQGEDKPRLVVMGDASWVSNVFMAERSNAVNYDLFTSMLSWLRERPNSIGIDAKKRETYTLPEDANLGRMFWTPLILMLVGIVGLGAGVWIVRRR